jgi:hypothetical protein
MDSAVDGVFAGLAAGLVIVSLVLVAKWVTRQRWSDQSGGGA